MNINNNPYYQRALAFIRENDLNALECGRHEIDGDSLFVNIVDSRLKTAGEAKLEAHDRYIDIQVPLSCAESYGVRKRSECVKPCGEFDAVKDIIFFEDKPQSIQTRQKGEMIVFGPDEAHAPLIGEGEIHKAIFKVLAV